MKNSKRFLAFISSILLIVTLMPISLAASSNDFISRDRNIANQVLSKVTALFTDVYTITDASASVKNKTADKSGNTVYTIAVSFKRTLKATSATEIPLVQGLLSAKSQLTGREVISAADAYITARMKDFNDNYIGVAQDTTGTFIITLPATSGSTLAVVPNSISINNITMENEAGDGTVPATSVAPRSASEQIQGGKALLADVVSATNNNARTNNSILTTIPNPYYPTIQSSYCKELCTQLVLHPRNHWAIMRLAIILLCIFTLKVLAVQIVLISFHSVCMKAAFQLIVLGINTLQHGLTPEMLATVYVSMLRVTTCSSILRI